MLLHLQPVGLRTPTVSYLAQLATLVRLFVQCISMRAEPVSLPMVADSRDLNFGLARFVHQDPPIQTGSGG